MQIVQSTVVMDTEKSDQAAAPTRKLKRNSFSFDDRWISKFQTNHNHTAEMMDFVDDSDSLSLASHDSACSSEFDMQPHHHHHQRGLPRRSSLKDLSKMAESAQSIEHGFGAYLSPQSTPGLGKREDHLEDSGGLGVASTRSGMSHSMILNWLCFKKYQPYPTIAEGAETPRGTPMDESTMDSAITVLPGPASGAPAAINPPTIQPSGKIMDAAKSFSSNVSAPTSPAVESPGKKNFSFKDLNAVAPSYW